MPALVFAAEISKTPFYIAGGLLVLWAVALAGLGLTQPEFPFGVRGQRSVIGVSLLLIAIVIAAAVTTN